MDAFVYGTLTEPAHVRRVLDSFVFVGPAVLHGLHLVEGVYPTLAPGGKTAGRLLRTDETGTLDQYERVDDGLYVRVRVPLDGGNDHPSTATVYIGDPGRLGADATWPGDGPFAERVRAHVEANDVCARVGGSTPV